RRRGPPWSEGRNPRPSGRRRGPTAPRPSSAGTRGGSGSKGFPQGAGHGLYVLVPAAREGHNDDPVGTDVPGRLDPGEDRVGGLQGGQDPLEPGEELERLQGLRVLDRDEGCPARVLQGGELGAVG